MFSLSNYSMNFVAYSLVFIVCITSSVAYVALTKLEKPVFRFFAAYAVLTWIYSVTYFFQTMANPLWLKLIWADIKVTALCFTPMVWLWLSFLLTKRKLPGWKSNMFMISVALANIFVVWNDAGLHIFRSSVSLYPVSDSLMIFKPTFGIWFMTVYMWSIYLPAIISFLIYMAAFLNSGPSGRFQYGVMSATVFFALFSGAPQVVGLTYFDTYAFATVITSIIFFFLINKYHIFDLVPVAHNTVFDMVESGIVIFDSLGRVAESNAYALKTFPAIADSADMATLCRMFSIDSKSVTYDQPAVGTAEFSGPYRFFSAKLIVISETGRSVDGYILYISDITDHRKYEQIQREKNITEQKNIVINDIHDSISDSVTVISMIAAYAQNNSDNMAQTLHKIRGVADSACGDVCFMMSSYEKNDTTVRGLIYDMRCIGGGLMESVDMDFKFSVVSDNQENLDIDIGFVFYVNIIRFMKECVVNAVKHSCGTSVAVAVTVDNSCAVIMISDNGSGIGSEIADGGWFDNLRRRVSSIGARVDVESIGGTKITCVAPFKNQN